MRNDLSRGEGSSAQNRSILVNLVLRRRGPLVALLAGMLLYALGTACACVTWSMTNQGTGPAHYVGLYQCYAALHAAGFLALTVGIVLAGWGALRSPSVTREDRAEIVGAALALLIVVGGDCRIAATTSRDSFGHLIAAIGLALCSPLALGYGVHHTAAARRGGANDLRVGILWSVASLGVLLYAIGGDFIPVGPDARTNGIVNGVLEAAGVAFVTYSLMSARRHGRLSARSSGVTVVSLVTLAISAIGYAIASDIALGPNPTFDDIKYGYAIQYGVAVLAVLILAAAVGIQLRQVLSGAAPEPS